MATVTALRAAARDRVAVELDGAPWRTLPAEAALAAGLAPGLELDRARLRRLRRELRRVEAAAEAARALRARDRSRRELDERLARRGVAPAARRATLEALARGGAVDDDRLARARADELARRGRGDAAIRFDLERRGVAPGAVQAALAGLEPERERAARIARDRGRTLRTARALAAAGFDAETVADAVGADVVAPGG